MNVNPIITEIDRRLRSNESIQSYFDDKTRLIELAKAPMPMMVALLTDGMPESYKSVISAGNPLTIGDWLETAQRFETSKRKADTKPLVLTTDTNNERKDTRKRYDKPAAGTKSKPNNPCPRCTEYGVTSFHWLRDCKRERLPQSQPHPNTTMPKTSAAAPLNGNGSSHSQ